MNKFIKTLSIYIIVLAMVLSVLAGVNTAYADSNEDGDIITQPNITDNVGNIEDLEIPTTTAIIKETTTSVTDETTISVGGPISEEAISKAKKLKTKIISATKKKKKAKKAKIVLKKNKKASGYQIKFSTNKKFKKAKTKTYKKYKFTLKKLKPGQKYYVKARTYVKFGVKKIYGKWSKAKKIKVR